jgi:molybdopterin/thiamine biosynthesis adenylyltransferase
MPGKFHHENVYRGVDVTKQLADARITLCGAGALGSNLADTLARQGFQKLRIIDRDRVEEHNVGTQTFNVADVGAWKVDVLKSQLFRAVGIEIETYNKELAERTVAKFLKDATVVLDLFDNSASRSLVQSHCRGAGLECLHVGLFADYGEIIWDADYRVPSDSEQDLCDYPLARNLVQLTVAVAAETLLRFLVTGERINRSLTLRDFAVRELER